MNLQRVSNICPSARIQCCKKHELASSVLPHPGEGGGGGGTKPCNLAALLTAGGVNRLLAIHEGLDHGRETSFTEAYLGPSRGGGSDG